MRKSSTTPFLTVCALSLILGVLLLVTQAQAPTFSDEHASPGATLESITTNPNLDNLRNIRETIRLRLASGEFDPLVEPVPTTMPDGLTIQAYEPGHEGYYIVQFDGPVTEAAKASLQRAGVQVFDYLPAFAFVVKMDEATRETVEAIKSVRWVGVYQPGYKVKPSVLRDVTIFAENLQEEFILTNFEGEDPQTIADRIDQLGGEILDISWTGPRSKIRALLDTDALQDFSRIDGVRWIEPAPEWKLFNDVGAGIMTVSDVWNNHNLYGSGQIVAVADTGLDKGTGDPANLHDDFEDGSGNARVSQIFDRVTDGANDVRSGHGTHVAGSVLGNGAESGSDPPNHDYDNTYAGMAPEATLVFQALEDNGTGALAGIPLDLNELFAQADDDASANIHTNSWGASLYGAYTSFSEDVDQYMWNNKDFLILFSAGNDGIDTDGDGVIDLISMGSPSTAKNCITVGATENNRPNGSSPTPGFNSTWSAGWPSDYPADPVKNDHVSDSAAGIAAFSSRGPCLDGRIKPDIVAPGSNIVSTKSSVAAGPLWGTGGLAGGLEDYYIFSGGTSMATPLVAGTATLVREFYTDLEAITPSAALIKATLLNGASDITPGQYGTGSTREIPAPPRPNNVEGWGRVDLEASLFPTPPRTLKYQDETPGLSTGETHIYTFDVDNGTVPLRASLVWTDYPASPVAGGGLVNDLDLILVDPDSTSHYPKTANQIIAYDDGAQENLWRFTGAGAGFAVKFTPTTYPAALTQARFFLRASATAQFRCNVWDDDGPGGMPGTNLFFQDVTPPELSTGSWFTVAITGVTIANGSFYVELRYTSTNDNNPHLGLDQTSPNNRSFVYDGSAWSQLPYAPISNGNWEIEAVVNNSSQSDRINNAVGIDVATPATGSYSIRVEGYNVPQGPQPYALVVSGGTLSVLTRTIPPQAPTSLAGQVISTNQVDLSWTDNSGDEIGFKIERKTGVAGTYTQIATVGENATDYNDTGVSGSTTYVYRVFAYNPTGDSQASNETSATTPTIYVGGGGGGGGGCFVSRATPSQDR